MKSFNINMYVNANSNLQDNTEKFENCTNK